MKAIKAAPLLALVMTFSLAACGERPQANDPNPDTTIGQKVREATNAARKKMAEENLTVSRDGQPKVEISPTGELLIDGASVPLDDSQRALVMQYRKQMLGVAEAGIEVGVQGANLGVRAAGEALKGIFNGDGDKVEARINAEAEKVKASAKLICDQLPPLMATQQKLAEAVPQFKPYATMDQSDIDDCLKDHTVSIP